MQRGARHVSGKDVGVLSIVGLDVHAGIPFTSNVRCKPCKVRSQKIAPRHVTRLPPISRCRAKASAPCEMSTDEPVDVPEPLAEEPDFAEAESDSVQADSVQGGEEQDAAESEVAESEVAESPFPVQTLKFDGDTPAKADDSADAIVKAIMAGVPEEEGEDADGDAADGEADADGDANADEATPGRKADGEAGAAAEAESPADASEMPNLPKRATPAFSYFLRDKYGSRPSREAGDAWKLLSDEEKGKYTEQHATDKARYDAEKEAYKRYLAEHPELGAAAAAASDELDPGGSVLPLAKVTLLRVGVRVGVWLGG